MVRERTGAGLSDWLAPAGEAMAGELRGFVSGIRQDQAAVQAALTVAWAAEPKGMAAWARALLLEAARMRILRANPEKPNTK